VLAALRGISLISDSYNMFALPTLALPWLTQQCRGIQGVEAGVLAIQGVAAGPLQAVACWPEAVPIDPALMKAANTAWARCEALTLRGTDRTPSMIACPLRDGEQMLGVVALRLRTDQGNRLPVMVQALQWAMAWLSLSLRYSSTEEAGADRLLLDLLTSCIEVGQFDSVALKMVNELGRQVESGRVSLGWRRGSRLQLTAVSGVKQFDRRSTAAQALVSAMQEAADSGGPVLVSVHARNAGHLPAHAELMRMGPERSLLSLPLSHDNDIVGVVTLEFIDGNIAESELLKRLQQILAPVTGLLVLRARDHYASGLRKVAACWRRMSGARDWGFKTAVALVLLAMLTALLPGEFRVSAPAELEGRIQRAIVAPQDGFIASAQVRPGDQVLAGQEIASLDARDLELQRANWQAELDRFRKTYRNALAERDWAASRIAGAQVAQAQAQLGLVNAQLARTRLLAPLDGVVVEGDLQQSLGAPVQRGQTLLQIAPLDGYRVVINVDERDIANISAGQTGTLILTGAPASDLPVSVESVTPVAGINGGHNRFRVEARLLDTPDWLRPGMTGQAKLAVGERSNGWIWTHRLVDWLRLALWKLAP
jgi:RND family efflux transporter MFP subunit